VKKQKATKEYDVKGGKLSALKVFDRENFFEMVWQVVRLIPKGRVTSYGAIAKYLGSGLSARMVGWAMNAAHNVKPKVPAHRVLNRNGMLTGKHHFATPSRMQELLEREKINVENDTVVNFDKLFWDPAVELEDY
jgi:methylated-DNA-protein-cysteine methyltransferase-like protein